MIKNTMIKIALTSDSEKIFRLGLHDDYLIIKIMMYEVLKI